MFRHTNIHVSPGFEEGSDQLVDKEGHGGDGGLQGVGAPRPQQGAAQLQAQQQRLVPLRRACSIGIFG